MCCIPACWHPRSWPSVLAWGPRSVHCARALTMWLPSALWLLSPRHLPKRHRLPLEPQRRSQIHQCAGLGTRASAASSLDSAFGSTSVQHVGVRTTVPGTVRTLQRTLASRRGELDLPQGVPHLARVSTIAGCRYMALLINNRLIRLFFAGVFCMLILHGHLSSLYIYSHSLFTYAYTVGARYCTWGICMAGSCA